MMALRVGFLCFFVVLICEAKNLPSFIKVCKRKEDINACMKENIEIVKPYLKKGIPKLGIPSFGPLTLPEVGIDSGDFKLGATDFTVEGLDEFKLHETITDLEKLTFFSEFTFPHMRLGGTYSTKGKLLLLQLDGSGPLDVNITDLHVKLYQSGKAVNKEGKHFVDFDNAKVEIVKLGDANVNFANLFAKNEELTKGTNQAINDNIQEFFKELQPLLEETFGKVLQSILQVMYKQYPLEQLFPES